MRTLKIFSLLAALLCIEPPIGAQDIGGNRSLLGDADCDGVVTREDVFAIQGYILGEEPCCQNTADVNRDGIIDGLDITTLIRQLNENAEPRFVECPVPPQPNDLCDGAIGLDVSVDDIDGDGIPNLVATVEGSTAEGATPDPENATCNSSTAPGLWYSVTGVGASMSASLCGSAYDTKVSVFNGDCGGVTCVASNDDSCGPRRLQSVARWVPEEGTTYLVLVHGWGSSSGNFILTVEAAMQENDDCDGATELDLAAGQAVVAASTASAATVDAESADCGASNAPGLWYSAVGNGSAMSATTCHADTNYDTRLSVFSGGCGALACVTNNDDSCDISVTRSTVNWDSEDGVTYFILVHGYFTRVGDFTLIVDQSAPDSDGDGVPDSEDACDGHDDNIDTDGDGIPDGCDVDNDNDGTPDSTDNCPTTANDDQADTDGDGVGDVCERIRFVKSSGPGGGTGNSWDSAYNSLQTAIEEAIAGDDIWVQRGTYKPTDGDDRTVSFVLKDNVALYGGFAGNETERNQRDPALNTTILSANIGRSDKFDNSYNVVKAVDLSSGAILDGFTISGVSSRLAPAGGLGFEGREEELEDTTGTLGDANCDGEVNLDDGDVIRDHISSGTVLCCPASADANQDGVINIQDLVLIANISVNGAEPVSVDCTDALQLCEDCPWDTAGMVIQGGGPQIQNCSFLSNEGLNAGAVMIRDSSPTFRGCYFSENSQENTNRWSVPAQARTINRQESYYPGGGAVYIMNNAPSTQTFIDCEFYANKSARYGGAIFKETGNINRGYAGDINCDGIVNATDAEALSNSILGESLSTCCFEATDLDGNGIINIDDVVRLARIIVDAEDPIIINCSENQENLLLVNCSVRGNTAASAGGGVLVIGGDFNAANCLFHGNEVTPGEVSQAGALLLFNNQTASITNCTFHANRAAAVGGVFNFPLNHPLSETVVSNTIFSENLHTQLDSQSGIRNNPAFGSANFYDWRSFEKTTLQFCGLVRDDDLLRAIGGDSGPPGNILVEEQSPFVQPYGPDGELGTDDDLAANLRLPIDSTLRDKGLAGLLPDVGDIDGDGNVAETIPTDLQGIPRIYGDLVDLGAFEWHPDLDQDLVIDTNDNCRWIANAAQEDLNGDLVGDACHPGVDSSGDPQEISVSPIGGRPGDTVTITGHGFIVNGEFLPRVEFGNEVAEYSPVDPFAVSEVDGRVALNVLVPRQQSGVDVACLDITVTNRLSEAIELSETSPPLFVYSSGVLNVGQRVPLLGCEYNLVPTEWPNPIWHNPATGSNVVTTLGDHTNLYLVALRGSDYRVITWGNSPGDPGYPIRLEITYETSYAESPQVIIADGQAGGGPLPADLDYNAGNYEIFHEEGYNTNEAYGVIYDHAVYSLDPSGTTLGGTHSDNRHVLLKYLPENGVPQNGDIEFATYEVLPGEGYVGIIGGRPTYHFEKDVGNEIGAFYPLSEFIKCVFPLPEELNSPDVNPWDIGVDLEYPIFTTLNRVKFWQKEVDQRIFVVNSHPDPEVTGRIFARWPKMTTRFDEVLQDWAPVCVNVNLDDSAYMTDYLISWPDNSHTARISTGNGGPGVGAPLPTDLDAEQEHGILDLAVKKENLEKAFILDTGGEDEEDANPLVFATNVRCGDYCAGDPANQHVIVHYRNIDGEFALQIYDVDPGVRGAGANAGSYNQNTGRMLIEGGSVGDLLEPIYPLDILFKRRNTTLPDRNILLMGHTRVWKNPAGGRLNELYCVNASPGDQPGDDPLAESILVSWPRITTKQDLDGRWREIDVFDTDPAQTPYVQEFLVAWNGPRWSAPVRTRLGDANCDGEVNLDDGDVIRDHISSGTVLCCPASADANQDGVINILDFTWIASRINRGLGIHGFANCGGRLTTVISNEEGAPLPSHWQTNQFGEAFSIEKVRVFEAPFSGTGGNLNDEHALIYKKKEVDSPDEANIADWALFALQAPHDSFNDHFPDPPREGGEGWILLQHTWDEGRVEFASYKVEAETGQIPLDKDPVAVGSRILPYYPLDEILFGSNLALPASLDISVVPDPEDDSDRLSGSSTGWWINDLKGALDPAVGSHIYAVNRGNRGQFDPALNPHQNPSDAHITVRWRIPKGTLSAQDDLERKAYLQTFQIHWPDSDAFAFDTDGIDNDSDGEIDEAGETAYSTVFIKGLSDDGANRICLTPDDNPAGCDKVFYDARVFDGIGQAAITGGFPDTSDANPNDEHALILSGKLYAGRDDSFQHQEDDATRPWVLLGYQAEEGSSPLIMEPFKVERQDFARRYYLVGNLLQNPVPYRYLGGYPNCAENRIVKADKTALPQFGWRDPNGALWFNRKWPLGEWETVTEGPSAHFDFQEWWYPEDADPATEAIEMRIGRNDCTNWIDVDKDNDTVDNIEIRADWPTQPGIGPGYYTRLYVGEAIDRSGHQAIEIIFNGNDAIDNDGDGETDEADELEPTDPDREGAHIKLLVQSERDACDHFCVIKSERERGSAPPGYYKFVSAISQDVKAIGRYRTDGVDNDGDDEIDEAGENSRDHHWATIATIDEVVSVETFKIQCPPVRGMIVPVGNKCAFSPNVKLRFWPLRSPPEDYGAEILETGLYDEETIPEDLLESLYGGVEGITFTWEWIDASDFNKGLRNWITYPDVDGPVLEMNEESGIQLIMDRYYRVHYTGYEACRGEVPPRADTQLQVEVSVDGELQEDVNDFSELRLSADQNSNGGQWNYLGSISAAASQNIAITFGGNEHEPEEQGEVPNLFADAVRIVQVERNGIELSVSEQEITVIDNDDIAGRTSSTGGAWTSIVSPGQYGSDAFYFNSTGATVPQNVTFTWEYETPADDNGVYDIYVWWPESAPGVEADAEGYWYSPWTDAMLLPGWVKRIVQGMDLENFNLEAFESEGDILVSASEIIGQRADDTIAFNCDPENLNELGLLDIYTNVLHYARNFSIGTGTTAGDDVETANQALLLVTSRIGQMLMMLGNEAYADALDPTIGSSIYQGSDLEPEKYFAFHNQMPSLLEEELALLRGRPKYPATLDMVAPVFNRITWNWTSDLAKTIYTAAYRDAGIVTIEDAMQKFPQGHGDAWGHYIGASKVFYSLLSNPYFTWTNLDEDVLVAGRPVKVGFRYMRQFAEAAAARARAGRDIVALEFRKQYKANPEDNFTSQGYIDEHDDERLLVEGDSFEHTGDEMRAWGLHDWAARAATSSYIDWAVVSSRLPAHSDQVGLKKVDRTTVKELDEIAANHREIVQQINIADSGLNPLGLAGTVVPFDLDANALQQSNLTHFEQTLQKATNAVGSAVAVLNFANQSQNRLREQQRGLEDFIVNTQNEELRYTSRLIEIFGRPYPDDLAYPSNYDGPDFLHFDYIDLGALSEWNDEPVNEISIPFLDFLSVNEGQIIQDGNERIRVEGGILMDDTLIDRPTYNYVGFDVASDSQRDVTFHYSSETGFSTVPNDWSSPRPEEGQLQQSLRAIHISLGRLEQSRLALRDLVDGIEADVRFLEEMHELQGTRLNIQIDDQETIGSLENWIRGIRLTLAIVDQLISTARGMAKAVAEAVPTNLIVGLAAGGDMASIARGALKLSGESVALVQFAVRTTSDELQGVLQDRIAAIRFHQSMRLAGIGDQLGNLQAVQNLEAKIRTIPGTVLSANLAREEIIQAVQGYKTQLGTALRLVEERDRFRKKTLRDIRDYRHNSLTFRLFHNDAMQKYRAQFDMASRYAYLAAQTFDYETNLLGSGFHIGRFDDVEEALEKIIQARSPGAIIGQNPAGGSGLTGVLFELGTSFEALKSAIRIPQATTREFSLRRSLLQIPPAGAQNHEEWRTWLEERVVDLRDFPDIRRLAQLEETIAADDDPGEPGVIPKGLVIEFPTGIANTSNFFLNESLGGDPGFSPEHLATKILKCGVYFSNYPHGIGRLSPTPYVYLVPAGASVMRVPISTEPGIPKPIREFQLVDQIIPPVLSTFLDTGRGLWRVPDGSDLGDPAAGWRPGELLQGCIGRTCFIGDVRKINPFVAGNDSPAPGNPQRGARYAGLAGRTAWNTQWYLVIPGRNLGAQENDPTLGLQWLINGQETGEGRGITDIILTIEAYSYENPF